MDVKRKFYEDFFKFLGYSCIELRVINSGSVVFQDSDIRDPFRFAQVCCGHDGKGQVYFGVQERDGKGGAYENVPTLKWVPIDVDAKREDKQTQPANKEQRQNALRNAEKVIEYLKSNGVEPSLILDTGNGVLILVRIPTIETKGHFYNSGSSVRNELSDMINYWLQHSIAPLCDGTVEVDSVGDLPRVLGVPATVNVKGYRRRKIIHGSILKQPVPQTKLWSLIKEAYESRKEAKPITQDAWKLGEKLFKTLPKRIKDKYSKKVAKKSTDVDRSKVLLETMLFLAKKGFTVDTLETVFNAYFTPKIRPDRMYWPIRHEYEKAIAKGQILSEESILQKFLQESSRRPIHPMQDYRDEIGLILGTHIRLEGETNTLIITPGFKFRLDKMTEVLKINQNDYKVRKDIGTFTAMPRFSHAVLHSSDKLLKYGQIEKISSEKVFQNLLSKHVWYLFQANAVEHIVICLWIMGTYMYQMFQTFPILAFCGLREVGKGTNLSFVTQCSWNTSVRMVVPTLADLSRRIHSMHSTISIDEAKYLGKVAEFGAMNAFLESVTEKGVGRPIYNTETGEEEIFETYAPLVYASRGEIPIENKAIRITMVEPSDKKYGKRRSELEVDKDFDDIVEDLVGFALVYAKDVKREHDLLEPTDEIYGRDFQLWRPIFAMCKVVCPEKYDDVCGMAIRSAKQRRGEYKYTEIGLTLLRIVLDNIPDMDKETVNFFLTQLRDMVREDLGNEKIHANTIIAAINNLKITKESYPVKGKGKQYVFNVRRVISRAIARGIKRSTESPKEEDEEQAPIPEL